MFIDLLLQELGDTKPAGEETRFCCPFCDERDHKFYVHNKKGLWICFKCEESGNPVKFVKNYYGVGFTEAADILLTYDYDVKEYSNKKNEPSKIPGLTPEEQLLLFISNGGNQEGNGEHVEVKSKCPPPPTNIKTLTANFNNPEAFPFFAYLHSRGVTLEQIKAHNISYVINGEVALPNGDTLRLVNHVVFFAFNHAGKPIYWNTRSIEQKPFIKSFNAPSSDVEFSKSTVVFNINNACKTDKIVVTEGVFNALTVGDSGVSTYGKHVSKDQIRIMLESTKQHKQPIYLFLDKDAWEQMITLSRKIKEIEPNREVYFVYTGTDEDANDLGPEGTKEAIENAFPADSTGELKLLMDNA